MEKFTGGRSLHYWAGREEDHKRRSLYATRVYMEENIVCVNEWKKISRILDRYVDQMIGEEWGKISEMLD
jgi:hypothetical protein